MNEKPDIATSEDRLAQLSPVKRALFELQELRDKLKAMEQVRTEPIAIIGMGCRFPGGANSPDAFWQCLLEEVDAITEVPPERWDIDAYYEPDPLTPGKMSTRWGGFLPEIDKFDPQFFGIAPREAVNMDPQHRLLLEVSWEALEHAGQAPDRLQGSRTGVFVGMSNMDYAQILFDAGVASLDTYMAQGVNHSAAPGRLSYLLGLQGPAMAVDTACSSSLVAVHLGVQSLRNRECEMALVGGVNAILIPEFFIGLSKLRMMAADGRCKTFDARADGFVRAEGCGIVVLKRLSDALANRDTILAVIRGSAVNQDGRSNGFTAPSEPAQVAVIQEALTNGKIKPEQIGYVEAHGTGTSLGDPIEVQALGWALCQGRAEENPLLLGSVKTNLGHLEAAAGVAGLIKVVLSLQHGEIPAHLHLREPNPYIPWADLPIAVPTQRTPFPAGSGGALAGVSSFGFSGTNAHVVVEAAPVVEPKPAAVERPVHLLTLSAHTAPALRTLSQRYAEHLASPQASLADICFTANAGRAHQRQRLAVVAASTTQLREQLVGVGRGDNLPGVFSHASQTGQAAVAFLFTGQGAQYVGMGRQLYETQPAFRQALEECDELLRPYLAPPLLAVLYAQDQTEADLLDQTAYTQPALFAVEYALAELWRSWGVEPAVVAGHSVGEYVAACVAGVFSLADGLQLIAERGRLMQSLPCNGAMAAAFADEARVAEILRPHARMVSLAAHNGPQHTVISGEQLAVQAVVAELAAVGVKTQRLPVSHAFHSPLMAPILDAFGQTARQMTYHPPQIPLISNLTGRLWQAEEGPDATYWRRHVREPVRFADGIEQMYAQGHRLFVEVGPSPTLLGMARRVLEGEEASWLPSLRRGRDDWEQMLHSLAALYTQGVEVDWAGFDRDYPRRRVPLPTYPFQRQRYWIETGPPATANGTEQSRQAWERWLHTVDWLPQERTTPAPQPDQPGDWLIFADGSGLGETLAAQLRWQGARCAIVRPGKDYARLEPEMWQVNPACPAHFEQLLRETEPVGGTGWRGILHLWSTQVTTSDDTDASVLEQNLLQSCGSVLHLLQALAKTGQLQTLSRLWLVTQGAQAVVGTEAPEPAQAPLWGLAQTIALEYPYLHGSYLDLGAMAEGEQGQRLFEEVWSPDGEDRIAYRNGSRFVARLTPATVKHPGAAPSLLKADASYLITGGLGSLGLLVARWMVAQGARHLVLMGRSGAASEAARRAVQELEQAGACVIVARGDVSCHVDVHRIVTAISKSPAEAGFGLPPLRGVVHAAGAIKGGMPLESDDWNSFVPILAPKVAGTWNLHALTRDLALDFFVLFSSAASVLGQAGHGSYAVANAFLDTMAHFRQAHGLPALSINWGAWADQGMLETLDSRQRQIWHKLGMGTIDPSQGIQVLEHVLGGASAQVCVLPIDWPTYLASFAGEGSPFLARLEISERSKGDNQQTSSTRLSQLLEALAESSIEKAHGILLAHVQQLARTVLGLYPDSPIQPQQPLRDLGLDSLMAVELGNLISSDLGVRVTVSDLLQGPSSEEIVAIVLEQLAAADSLSPAPDRGRKPEASAEWEVLKL